nr:GGDEF domain-containing protein [Novosphingobium sp. 9]
MLCTFADLLRETLREEDVISRIGSERFAVLLPRTTPEAARAICARVVSTLSERHEVLGNDGLRLTASGGVVRIAQSLDSTLERAEMALFSARAKGRNRLEPERELHRQTN